MTLRLFALLALLFSFYAKTQADYPVIVVDQLISVYDGDTFKITQKDCPKLFCEELSVRIYGVDTPEIRGSCNYERLLGLRAKYFVQELLYKSDTIVLQNPRRDKYFRITAEVYADGVSVAEELIKAKLGRPYYGGRRDDWCADHSA